MGGFFGVVSKRDCIIDVFFGVDYHSHLGTSRAGMAAFSEEDGFQRHIHNIENSPFRTKFEGDVDKMKGNICIGCISDRDPQPLLIYSHNGMYAISIVGRINNKEELASELLESGKVHFGAMGGGRINSTELVATLIDQKETVEAGIEYAQSKIDGSMSILVMKENAIIAARDKLGRTPVILGKDDDGYCVSFESFAFTKLGYEEARNLGPGEIIRITADGIEELKAPGKQMKICSFLWTYFGYPNSSYEGVNVEVMRNRNGGIMAREEMENGTYPEDVDYVCGVPDSGVAHAVGYSNQCHKPYARPFIKYTPTWPRSFMPKSQNVRNHVAKMKLIPVENLIGDKKLMFVDDSIVRGTQLQETVDFLYSNGAKEVHMRSACPPIMFGCKYLNFSRSTSEMDLICRRVILEIEGEEGFEYIDEYSDARTERGKKMRKVIADKLGFKSLEYQSLAGLVEAIGLPEDCVCTYCWNGKE